MKKLYFLLVVSACIFSPNLFGQLTLSSSPYLQDFNTIGSGLPAGWSVRTVATSSALGTSATLVTSNTAWNSTTGNFRNVASATGLTATASATNQNNSANRALAIRQTAAFGDPGGAFVLQLSNTTGLSNFSLSFKLQSLDGSVAGRTTTWQVGYGIGSAPTTFTTVTTSPSILATTLAAGGANWGSTDVTVNFGTAVDNQAENVWLRIAALSGSTGSGSRPTTAIDDVQLSYASGDVSAPVFHSTYPKIASYTADGFTLLTSLSEPGTSYFVVLPGNATAPSSARVKNGQDASGNLLPANQAGAINVTNSATEYSRAITGLTSDTEYDLYVVAEDLVPNVQASPVKVSAKTNVDGDVTPPSFSVNYPTINSILPDRFTVSTRLDEQGKTYFVVLNSEAAAPSSAQVKNGQDASGSSLLANRFGSIQVTSTVTEFSSVITGLNAATPYDVYIVAEDNVPNLLATPTKVTATTGNRFTENFNNCDGIASFTQYNVAGAQEWGCTDFGRGSKGIRMNGFAGSAVANEDWLISPLLSLGSSANLSFYSQFSFAGNGLQLKVSTNYAGSGNPSAATWSDLNGNFPTVSVGSTSTVLADWTLSNVDLSAFASQNIYVAFVYTSTAAAASRWTLDEITINNASATYLEVTPSALLFTAGNTVKSYEVKGYNLNQDVSINAPTNFSVSKDNNTFSATISFTPSEVATPKTVFVKFTNSGGSLDTFSGVISNASTGVATKNVSVKGTDKTQTFDIATYNLEFFGTDVKDTGGTEFGPIDDALQVSNVTRVLETISADIYGVQEVSDDIAFNQLVTNLSGYSGILSPKWSYSFNPPDPNFPPQKVGFVYNNATSQLVGTRVMFSKLYDDIRAGSATLPGYPTTSSSFWSSGRLPFMATFDVTINGTKKRLHVITIHAKSGSAIADYNRRKYDVKVLYDSLVANYANDNIVLLGDFNDDVDSSIAAGQESSYKVFVDNATNFNTLTYTLSQTGAGSFPNSNSFLDHIITSNKLSNDYISSSLTIEDPRTFVSNYINSTSDHLPVSARFNLLKENQTITFNPVSDKLVSDTPFPLTATSTSSLSVSFSTTSSKITVAGSQVTIVSAGRASITANQSGNSSVNAANPVTKSFCIKPAKPTVTTNLASGDVTLTSNAASGNQWFLNGTAIVGATNAIFTPTDAATYKVQVTIDDCVSEFSSDTPVIITGDLRVVSSSISYYPNPASQSLYLVGLEPETNECILVDLMGKVFTVGLEKSGEQHRLPTENLAEGVYAVRISHRNSIIHLKFIKKN